MRRQNSLNPAVYRATYEGVSGETIFHRTYMNFVLYDEDLKNRALLERLGAYKDDRSKAIIAALVCEKYLDRMLAVVFPGYSSDNLKNAPFDTKIRMLQALRIVPLFVTKAADLLRRARNEFAHNLELDDLAGLPQPLQDAMRAHHGDRLQTLATDQDTIDEVFETIVQHATQSLIAFYVCLHDYNSTVRETKFEKSLNGHNERRKAEHIRIILEHANSAPSEPEVFSALGF